MSKKIFVGNLPFTVDDNGLQELFAQFGNIEEATMIKDKFSGRSKGFGFVTFSDDSSADAAIAEMNEKDVQGRNIKVSEAKPFEAGARRPPRRDFGENRSFRRRY